MRDALTGMGQTEDSQARVETLTMRHAPDCGRGQREPCTCGAARAQSQILTQADPTVVAVFEEFDRSIERGGDRYVRRSRTKAAARLVDLDQSHGGAAGQAAPLCGQPTRAGSCTFRAGHAGGCACGP
jgi:hypothetical protein